MYVTHVSCLSHLCALSGKVGVLCTVLVQIHHIFYVTQVSCMSHLCALSGIMDVSCTCVYTHAHLHRLIVQMCELYRPCPCMVIHTHVSYYKMVAYGDRPSYVYIEILIFLPSQHKKLPILSICSIIT